MTSEQQALNKMRETFIKSRTEQEVQVAQWANKLSTAKPEMLAGIDLPQPLTLKTLIPELYEEIPNPEVYKEQYIKACELINQVNNRADKLNEEAILCLSKYNQLTSSQVS